mgnify:CR=1 FL=1
MRREKERERKEKRERERRRRRKKKKKYNLMLKRILQNTDILFAFGIIFILGLMIIPLSPYLLDFFLAINI